MTPRAAFVAVAFVVAASGACSRSKPPTPAPTEPAAEWQLLASELPQALLSVAARAPDDVYAVGADKGAGPLVLHFDGSKWSELPTGSHGDLWWVTVLPGGAMLLSGANATVLRYDGQRFESMKTPGPAKQTVYGVWGSSADDFYAVGSASGRSGFVWHFHGGAFENERIPVGLPRAADGDVPGFFKVFGQSDDVWVVGAAGALLHRKGNAPFVVVPTPIKDTLFTVHGSEGRIVAVGGSGNGVIVQLGPGAPVAALASPAGAGLFQGIFTSPKGDWATGERGIVYHRDDPTKAFAPVDHGLVLPAASSLHAVFVDAKGGVWSVGGNVLTSALDGGMLIHYGAPVPPVVIDDEPEADADAGVPVGGRRTP